MLNLEKSKQVVLDLTKQLGIGAQKAQVVLAIDYSGSMSSLYYNGTVQAVVERLVPIAMAFDNDEAMEVFRFDHHYKKMSEDVTPKNYAGYVDKYINKGSMGGTDYVPVMEAIVSGGTTKAPGFLKKLFGSKTVSETTESKLPTYVIFITDGDCSDRKETLKYIKEISGLPIFWQFVGIGHSSFHTLEQLDTVGGRVVDNANFFAIKNSNSLVTMSDSDLYSKLLTEFPDWIKEAKSKNIF